MIKSKRFMIEFANFKNSEIYDKYINTDTEKMNDLMRKVNYAVFDYEHGLITVSDAMKIIANIMD